LQQDRPNKVKAAVWEHPGCAGAGRAKSWLMNRKTLLGSLIALLIITRAGAGGVEVLSAYTGMWKSEVTSFDTAYSKAGKRSSTLRNDCWRGGDYFACHQIVDGESKALVVFTFDQKNNYSSYPITIGTDTVHAGTLVITDKTWTFPWEISENSKTMHFRVVNVFVTPNTIDYSKEYSEDGQHWVTMEKGRENKLP
jgi:hypothetical protein